MKFISKPLCVIKLYNVILLHTAKTVANLNDSRFYNKYILNFMGAVF